jgi:gas vesicle protein
MRWFFFGLGLGAIVALLYTPKTGAEMIDIVKEKIDETRREIPEEHYTIAEVINEGTEAV